jgi:PadR family transcriptional regulator PadR
MNAKFFDNWTNQIRKGFLELAILNDIRNRRMYGYEIERKFRKSQGLLLSSGTIYNILRRLRAQHLVETTETKSPDGPKRRYYRLTTTGHDTLAQMNNHWKAIKKQADFIERGRKHIT